jgi:hemolysin III
MNAPREVVPRLRGTLHLHALWVAVAAAVALVVIAHGDEARLSAAIYGVGLCALFGASALFHRWPGPPRFKPLLRRVDHSAIFLFIAASYTPVCLLVLPPPTGTWVLVGSWAIAAAGVALSVAWIDAPRALTALCYVAAGSMIAVAMPQLVRAAGVVPVVLFGAGGAIYWLGAFVYAARRPDPWPRVFGFHEVFHALVVAAAAVHFVAMAGWVIPRGRF